MRRIRFIGGCVQDQRKWTVQRLGEYLEAEGKVIEPARQSAESTAQSPCKQFLVMTVFKYILL